MPEGLAGSVPMVRIVVSGSHASGKSTLVSDFALSHPHYRVLSDPFDLVDDPEPSSAASFHAQLLVSAERLAELTPDADVILERGPLDLLAYLEASATLGRDVPSRDVWRALRATTAEAMAHVDLLVVLPLVGAEGVWVPDEEDPRLRTAMDEHLLDLCDDGELVGEVGCIIELTGSAAARLAALTARVHPG